MSSYDRDPARRTGPLGRSVLLAGLAVALSVAAGCTVRPLYGDVTSATTPLGASTSKLALVEVAPAPDRVGQEVRNHLIFLLGGGRGQPADPAYKVHLRTRVVDARASTISTSRVNLDPTSGIVTVRGSYSLTDAKTGDRISAGSRAVQAPYDIPRQEFAALRAVRNAEDRAARELAELLRLVIAQELEKPTSVSVPEMDLSSPEEVEELWRDEEDEELLLVR